MLATLNPAAAAMLALIDNENMTCAQIHKMTVDHLTSVPKKLIDLRRLERVLKEMAN